MTMPTTRLRPAGFTLIELLVVVMVMGVLAGVAAPRYTAAMAATRLEAATKRLSADMRRARSFAIERASAVAIEFDPSGDAYLSPSLADPDHPGQTLSVVLGSVWPGVQIATADFGGSPNLEFSWRGAPARPGQVTLSNGAATRTVSVNALGDVEVLP